MRSSIGISKLALSPNSLKHSNGHRINSFFLSLRRCLSSANSTPLSFGFSKDVTLLTSLKISFTQNFHQLYKNYCCFCDVFSNFVSRTMGSTVSAFSLFNPLRFKVSFFVFLTLLVFLFFFCFFVGIF